MPLKKFDITIRPDEDVLETHPSVNARTARSNFSRLVDSARVDKQRVVITEHGAPAAAIVPISDIKLLDELPNLDWVDKISDAEFQQLDLTKLKNLLKGSGSQNDSG